MCSSYNNHNETRRRGVSCFIQTKNLFLVETVIRQAIGIDCSKDKLDCCYGRLLDDFSQQLQVPVQFPNTGEGFKKLLTWANKNQRTELPLVFVVEATGVYHEQMAVFLSEQHCSVCVVLPNRISNFFRTTTTKTITDKSAAQMIAQFGLEKKLDLWQKPNPIFRKLRQLTRERAHLIEERTMVSNQLHAEEHSAWPGPGSIKRMKQRISLLNKQVKEIETELRLHICKEGQLKERVDKVCSIPGVNVLTAATVLGETNGFELIRNKKQLISYAGLDVIEKQSGTSIRGKARISKRGNKYLRKALYFPAFASIRFNPQMKTHYANLVSKHGIKMKGAVSVQRKLLVLIFMLWKKNQLFMAPNESGYQLLDTPTELDQIRPD